MVRLWTSVPVNNVSFSLSLPPFHLTHNSKPDTANGNIYAPPPVAMPPPPPAHMAPVPPAPAVYNAEDIKGPEEKPFYPNMFFADFSLPLSLSSIWKKKVDVLPPEVRHQLEMMQKMEEIKELNASHKAKVSRAERPKPASKKRKASQASVDSGGEESAPSSPSSDDSAATPPPKNSRSANKNLPTSADVATPTQVSEYETQIHGDHWPLDCIKCGQMIGNLENFNIHMNDHWSDDKCCPVCGLLINSKRFNFKQHLKIHTGEKPFVCQTCNRSFRQKAHMVKHMTTHRNGGDASAAEIAV